MEVSWSSSEHNELAGFNVVFFFMWKVFIAGGKCGQFITCNDSDTTAKEKKITQAIADSHGLYQIIS